MTGGGAAAIGAPYSVNQGTAVITCTSGNPGTTNTAGGNVIISSGTIRVRGGQHGAGIGGGWYSYYDGIIIVYGGIITADAGNHAASLGSGCPTGTGVTNCSGPNSTVVALPPAVITAPRGLAGASMIIYINDPSRSLVTVHTVDSFPNANIYLDLTETPGLENIFNQVGYGWYDLAQIYLGQTNSAGLYQFRAELRNPTTFFTDASSINPITLGRPYLPIKTTISGVSTNRVSVLLPLLSMNIAIQDFPSIPLAVGYSTTEAKQNAHRIKVSYFDPDTLSNISIGLQTGNNFTTSNLIFLGSDSSTVISAPSRLVYGDVFYIIVPIDQGEAIGSYSDVLRIIGDWDGVPMSDPIRRVVNQKVVQDDSYFNVHVKVTASPMSFTVDYPSTDIVTLNLNINHTSAINYVPYDSADVTAKYLLTTIADYDLALAANPFNSSGWKPMNVPATENLNEPTIVSFANMPPTTYYIHWYVESGYVSAHSLNVTVPPSTHGGFGPYELLFEICQEDSVTLTAVITDGGIASSFQWKRNGVNIPGATNSTYKYAAMTTDTISCVLTSNALCAIPTSVESHIAVITVKPKPILNSVTDVCVGAILQLTPTTGGFWTSTNPTIASVTNSGLVTGLVTGKSQFVFTDTNTTCTNITDTITVLPYPIATPITALRNATCVNDTIHLHNPTLGGIWSLSNTNAQIVGNSTDNPVAIRGTTIGNVYVTYTIGTTCQSKSTFLLKILSTTLPPEIRIGFEK
jgi:hypothetical protein